MRMERRIRTIMVKLASDSSSTAAVAVRDVCKRCGRTFCCLNAKPLVAERLANSVVMRVLSSCIVGSQVTAGCAKSSRGDE